MSYSPCTHKSDNDHSVKRADGVRIWRCSHCKTQGPWTEAHGYFGNLECRKCSAPEMKFVWCSDNCMNALRAGEMTTPKERKKAMLLVKAEGVEERLRAGVEEAEEALNAACALLANHLASKPGSEAT